MLLACTVLCVVCSSSCVLFVMPIVVMSVHGVSMCRCVYALDLHLLAPVLVSWDSVCTQVHDWGCMHNKCVSRTGRFF